MDLIKIGLFISLVSFSLFAADDKQDANSSAVNNCALVASWSALPTVILGEVFGFLSFLDRLDVAAMVCQRWNETQSPYKRLFLVGLGCRQGKEPLPPAIADRNLALILGICAQNMLCILRFEDCKISDASMSLIAELPNLRNLELEDCQNITDQGLQYSSSRPAQNLQYLSLENCRTITPDGLRHLSAMPGLRTFRFLRVNYSDESLRHLGTLTKLRALALGHIGFAPRNQNEDWRQLANLTRLEELSVSSQVPDWVLSCLAHMPKLKRLSLGECEIVTEQGFDHIANLSELEVLSLAGLSRTPDSLFFHLSSLKKLRVLKIFSHATVTAAGFEHLRAITTLEVLELRSISIEHMGAACQAIKNLPSLRSVELGHCKVAEEDLVNLGQIPMLEKLELFCREILVPEEKVREIFLLDEHLFQRLCHLKISRLLIKVYTDICDAIKNRHST